MRGSKEHQELHEACSNHHPDGLRARVYYFTKNPGKKNSAVNTIVIIEGTDGKFRGGCARQKVVNPVFVETFNSIGEPVEQKWVNRSDTDNILQGKLTAFGRAISSDFLADTRAEIFESIFGGWAQDGKRAWYARGLNCKPLPKFHRWEFVVAVKQKDGVALSEAEDKLVAAKIAREEEARKKKADKEKKKQQKVAQA